MDGLRAGLDRRGDDLVDHQVALASRGGAEEYGGVGFAHVSGVAVGLTEHCDGADAHRPQCADDADGDLSAVGYQYCIDAFRVTHVAHIRKTP